MHLSARRALTCNTGLLAAKSINLMGLVQGLQPALDAFVDLFGAANIGMRIVGLK